jgi:hypothetical protein
MFIVSLSLSQARASRTKLPGLAYDGRAYDSLAHEVWPMQTTARACNLRWPVISRRDSYRFRPDHVPLRLASGEVVAAKATVSVAARR